MKKSILSAPLLFGAIVTHAAEVSVAPIVVTANRTAQTANEVLAPVTVITRRDIEKSQAQSVLDILRLQPGVDLARTGGPGTNTSLFMRGTNSDHVLVLVDGVRADSATTGQFAWQHLEPSQIERIEIVRGPRASLYGSDAIGGVIQIFTRKATGLSAGVEGGAYDTYRFEVGYGVEGAARFNVNVSVLESTGFSATNPDSPAFNDDKDGYDNRSTSIGFAAPVGSAKLAASFWHSVGEVEFDEGTQDTTNQTADVRIESSIAPAWHQALRLGYALDDQTTESAFPSAITTRRLSASWQNDVSIGDSHLLSAGIDFYRDKGKNIDRASGNAVYDKTIRNTAGFANWQSMFGRTDAQIGLRYDHHSQAGGDVTGQLAFGHRLTDSIRAIASYGNAYKSPTLNQLFHPGFSGGFFAGNPDLDPERSSSAEVGLRFEAVNVRAAVNVFSTRVQDLIAYEGTNSQAINIAEASIRGIEGEFAQGLGPWTLQANLTLQQARNEADDSRLLRRPDAKFALALSRQLLQRGSVQGELLVVGDRADRNEELAGYGLVNFGIQYRIAKALQLHGRIENALDRDYALAAGYNTPGRSLFVGVRFTPQN